MEVFRGLFALSAIFFAVSVGAAEAEPCPPQDALTRQATQTAVTACTAACNALFGNENTKVAKHFESNCQEAQRRLREDSAADKVRRNLDLALMKCLPRAGVAFVTDLVKLGYASMFAVLNAADRRTSEVQNVLKKCDTDAGCRRELGRQLVGHHALSGAEIDKRIQGMDAHELLRRSEQHRQALTQDCQRELAAIRREVVRPGDDWTTDKHLQVSNVMKERRPQCIGLLNLVPPVGKSEPSKPISEIDKLTLSEKLAYGYSCFGDEFAADFCSQITKSVGDIALGGTTRVVRSAVQAENMMTVAARNAERVPVRSSASTTTSAAKELQPLKDKIFTSEAQNLAFISKANNPPKGTRFIDVENSVMKKLNDVSGDKDLVTGLTNLHKEIMTSKLDTLKAKYPGVSFDVYSDFKSMKIAIGGEDSLSPAVSAQLRKDLNLLLKESNSEFAGRVRKMGVDIPEAGSPEKWFKGGFGDSADEAALAARRARLSDQDGFMNYASPEVRDQMTQRAAAVEADRRALLNHDNFSGLLDRSDAKAVVPRTDVLDLARKYHDPESLAAAVRSRYELPTFSLDDARLLRSYARGVDEFSPTILIPKRETIGLENAPLGGTSADFLGLGSANLHATAKGLADKSDLSEILKAARAGERDVTLQFQRRMARFREIAGSGVRCSGDDCVQMATSALSDKQKAKLLGDLARDPLTRNVRMAFVGPNVAPHARMQLAAHGEAIEKTLRKELEGKVAFSKLQNLTFGLDMKSTSLNQGHVNLIIGKSANLTTVERREIERAFARALRKANEMGRHYGAGSTLTTERGFILLPNPGLITTDD